MSLLAMQRDFAGWLKHGDIDSAMRVGTVHAPGLAIYQNNYRAQLIACLEESFPQTLAWIGGEAFHKAMVAHIERMPPSSWTLDAYPRDFPATLDALYRGDPEIAELAWIEQALGEAFVGPDAPIVDVRQLGDIDWDQTILRFVPTLGHRMLITNAPALWSALASGEAPPPVEHLMRRGAVLIWRHEQVSRFRSIEARELESLTLARKATPFGELCGMIAADLGEEESISLAGALLGRWLADGLISGVEAGTPATRER